MKALTRVLVVEDDTTFRDVLLDHLQCRGFEPQSADSVSEARVSVRSRPPEVVVLDQRLPDGDGVALAQELLSVGISSKIILVTAHGDLARAVAATRAGVFDYLQKPVELDQLEETIRRAAKAALAERQWLQPNQKRPSTAPPLLIGASQPATRLRAQLEAAGHACPAAVLITGETGSGKGLAARLVHAQSPRSRGPFVVVNSAAIPDAMFEAELFGHERGAFTGATETRPGLFEQAHGGTLVLDEVGEIPLPVQSKLLRALEEGVVRRIGASAERPVNVRVVGTTNRAIEELVERGEFRRDLYFRIAVFRIEIPPLRERTDDLPALVRSLLLDLGIAPEVEMPHSQLEQLARHLWPGNVRELRNVLHRWVAARQGSGQEDIDALLHPVKSYQPTPVPAVVEQNGAFRLTCPPKTSAMLASDRFPTLAEVELEHISQALAHARENRTLAASLLGISRARLRRKLRLRGEP